ncbi:MAG: TipAS antibiotic-recognition domain-containing protein, partial [Gammaproteobacteria bacterium]
DWETITNIIEALKMKNENTANWAETYFTEEEMQTVRELRANYTPEQMQAYSQKWEDMFNEVKRHLPLDPTSKKGQELATKWLALVDEVYGKIPTIRKKLWTAYKAGAVPKDNMAYYSQEVVDFIDAASQHMKGENR